MNIHSNMDRRMGGARFLTDCPVTIHRAGVSTQLRAIDLSCSGALMERSSSREPPTIQLMEFSLRGQQLRTLARTVWVNAERQAVRFIDLSDADRLEIAEHLDAEHQRRMLSELD